MLKDKISPEKLSSVLQTAQHICSSAGVHLTEKRQKVLEILINSPKPLSAYDLVDQYQLAYKKDIRAMSVYRILEVLTEEHLVHRLNLNNKYIACSHISCCQEHGMSQFMICTTCGKVEEASIPKELLHGLTQRVTESGYSMVSPHLELACICHNCSAP